MSDDVQSDLAKGREAHPLALANEPHEFAGSEHAVLFPLRQPPRRRIATSI
jgi:hypothetical protein